MEMNIDTLVRSFATSKQLTETAVNVISNMKETTDGVYNYAVRNLKALVSYGEYDPKQDKEEVVYLLSLLRSKK